MKHCLTLEELFIFILILFYEIVKNLIMKIKIFINKLIDLTSFEKIDLLEFFIYAPTQNNCTYRKIIYVCINMSSFKDFVFKKYYILKSPLITTYSIH